MRDDKPITLKGAARRIKDLVREERAKPKDERLPEATMALEAMLAAGRAGKRVGK